MKNTHLASRFNIVDLSRIRLCAERLSRRSDMWVESVIRGTTVTLYERLDDLPHERFKIAQLRWDPTAGTWTLYRPGRSKWIRTFPEREATAFVEEHIARIEASPYGMNPIW